jgi:xanthine/CO dehydrogenase XdhC/CoxF family maturation factor
MSRRQAVSNEVYAAIASALESGEPVALATVASARGSTPRKPGAKMLVRPDGSSLGTIGGGCGEAEVWQKAMEVLVSGRPEIVHVDLTTPIDGDDKICGGVMDVFVERIKREPSA